MLALYTQGHISAGRTKHDETSGSSSRTTPTVEAAAVQASLCCWTPPTPSWSPSGLKLQCLTITAPTHNPHFGQTLVHIHHPDTRRTRVTTPSSAVTFCAIVAVSHSSVFSPRCVEVSIFRVLKFVMILPQTDTILFCAFSCLSCPRDYLRNSVAADDSSGIECYILYFEV